MAVTLTQSQIGEIALGMTRNFQFLDLYKSYRNHFPTSIYYTSARTEVVDFLEAHILSGYPSSTRDDAIAVLDYYDQTYGQDYLYDLLPIQVHTFDPDEILKGFFRAVADFRQYFVDLTKGLPALHNPYECPEEFLGWLGGMVGIEVPYDLPLTLKRLKIARAIPWYKIKGTHDSFRVVLRSIGFDAEVTELWSDYDGTQFSETPDVYPVLPDGSPNPAYDPNNTTDGLIKYKTSYFDIVLGIVVSSLPSDIIQDILDAIEEVRPITRTLRDIALGKFMEDDFPDVTDEVDVSAIMQLKDKYPFSSVVGPTCIDYSCGAPEFALYDGLSGYQFDGTIDYGTDTPICTVFYDNAEEGFFDGLLIADYSGLLDDQGLPFQYSGVYNATLTYGECSEKDELTIDIAMGIDDDFWQNTGFLKYDHLDVFFDNTMGLYYDNLPGAFDDLEIEIDHSVADSVSVSDDADFEVQFNEEDAFLDAITYDGEYNYDPDCPVYDGGFVASYDGTYSYDGTIDYYIVGTNLFDGSTGWNYDCNPAIYFDNQPYLPDELDIIFSDFTPEDTFSLPTDEIEFALGIEQEDNFSLPTDDLEVSFVEELFDYFANPYIYDGTLSYGGTAPLFGGYGLFYDGTGTFGSFGTYAGAPDLYDGSLTYGGNNVLYGGDNPYDDELEMSFESDIEDSVSISDDLTVDIGKELEDTVSVTDDGDIDLESEVQDTFYADVYFFDGNLVYDGTENYDVGPVPDSLDIELSGTEEDSLPSSEEFSSESEANFEETVSVSDEIEQVISLEDISDPFGDAYLFGDGDLTYGSSTNIVLGGDSYDIQPTYDGFALPVYDELEIIQQSALIDNWDEPGNTWDTPGDTWDA